MLSGFDLQGAMMIICFVENNNRIDQEADWQNLKRSHPLIVFVRFNQEGSVNGILN